MNLLSAWLCGWLFALGLGLAGMTQPERVVGFLDVAGTWDPRLAWVMGGAVALGLLAFPWVLRRPRPLWVPSFQVPDNKAVDGRLLAGAALFGVGWGLSGYCPGPAVVSAVAGNPGTWVFLLAMLAGLGLARPKG